MTTNLIAAPKPSADHQPAGEASPAAGVETRHGFSVIALLAGLVGAASFTVPEGPLRLLMLLAFLVTGPGAVLVSFPRITDRLVSWALTVTASLSIACGVAVTMLWTHIWHADAAIMSMIAAVSITAFVRLARLKPTVARWPGDLLRVVFTDPPTGAVAIPAPRPAADTAEPATATVTPVRRRILAAVPIGSLLAGAAAWVYSLVSFDSSTVDGYGLTAAMGAPFVVAVLLIMMGFSTELFGRTRRSVLTGGLLLVTAVLHATVPLAYGNLEYAWTYKHIGTVDLIRDHGHLLDSDDIYQMWPGFFATLAMPSGAAGVDALTFATWSSLAFGLINLLLMAALLRQFTTNRKVVVLGVALFQVCMWVDTGYFSPQAFVYSLMLGFWLIVTRWLMGAPPAVGEGAGRLARARANLVRGLPMRTEHDLRTKVFAGIAASAVFAAIVVSHQLSPFLMMIPATLLVILGIIRPRVLLVVWALVLVAFVAPRLPSVVDQYGLFDANVVSNATGNAKSWGTDGQEFSALVARTLALSVWAFALLAIWPARKKLGGVLVPVVLGFSPFVTLAAQSYGGEAIYRVFAFSLPFAALLIAGRWVKKRRGMLVGVLSGVILTAATLATLQGLQGQVVVHQVPTADIKAAQYFYSHAEPGSLLVLTARNFPTRLTGSYGDFNKGRAMDVALIDDPVFHQRINGAELPLIEQYIRNHGVRDNYLVVSTQMSRYTDYFGMLPKGSMASLESALRTSTNWYPFYQGDGVAIYQLSRPL